MYTLMILLALMCPACENSHPVKSDCRQIVSCEKQCTNPNCKCKNCDCTKDCPCGKEGHLVPLPPNTEVKTLKVNEVNIHVVPTDEGFIIDADVNKTIPIDIHLEKIKTGGYKVSIIACDRSVVIKKTETKN